MDFKQHDMIDHLATELQHWLWLKLGDKTPSTNEVAEFIKDHLIKFNQHIVVEEKVKTANLPALLKRKPDSPDAKRMRELAGIRHKGNFV